ncbi:MAG: MBL fold metallo-hydrolase [Acidobacteriota bacterium]
MSEEGLYEKVLAAAAGAPLTPPKAPRPSASVILWRRQAGDLQVFWVRRSDALAFMGGWYAFPGGGISRRDAEITVVGKPAALPSGISDGQEADPLLSDGVHRTPPTLVPGLLVGALRELFEETGLLLTGDALPTHDALAEARRRLLAEEADFGPLLAELGVSLSVDELTFAGRWLTPPLAPRRFDNRFFLLPWPADRLQQPQVLPGELDSGEWVVPEEAAARWSWGDVVTAPPILHALRVLAEDGPEAGLPRLLDPREANLGPFRRIEFRPGVILLPLETATLPPANRTNAYLLGDGERVLVDPGSTLPAEQRRLEEALAALPADSLKAIWLTHHHPDHVGGVAAARQALGVPVLAHAATAQRLAARGIPVDGELQAGQRVVLDGPRPFPIRVLHTPGHARGHLCFYEENGGSLIAGDMVAGIGTIVIDPPEGDMDDYLASLESLAELAPRVLFPAHGPPIRDAVGKLRHYIDHRRWREEKVLAAWQNGVRQPAELLPVVYDDAPRQAWPLAERQIVAHLESLERAGRLVD